MRVFIALASGGLITACTETPVTPAPVSSAPQLIGPADGRQFRFDEQPLTLWVRNVATTGAAALTYSFEVASDSGFASLVYTKEGVAQGAGRTPVNGQTSLTIDTLPANSYFWRARAFAGGVAGPFAQAHGFVVGSSTIVLPGPGITLSGGIFEVLPDGTRRPTSARTVDVEVDVGNPSDPQHGGSAPVGADGRYRVSGVPDGRFVKISSVDTTPANLRYRFCATNTITRGDTELDIALFLPGAAVPTPTLSGQVSAAIDGKQVPVAGADIYFRSRANGPDVHERTDSDGRYSLCGIPPIPGVLYMICGNDADAYRRSVDIQVDTVIDIDATSFYRCL